MVRDEIGAIARLEGVLFVDILPKTKTGKNMRKVMAKIMNGEPYKVPPTIDDESAITVMKNLAMHEPYFETQVIRPNQRFKPE